MKNLITIASFANSHDIKFSLLKDMLKQAGINYLTSNENARTVEPFIILPSNMSIEVKVYEADFNNAKQVWNSIK